MSDRHFRQESSGRISVKKSSEKVMAPLEPNCLSDVASLNSFIAFETIGQHVKVVLPVRGAMRQP